ncbi:hypothetical protein GP486_006099, partial [Trichoglossum hirsutum]
LPITLSTPVKRRYSPPSTFEADSENVDPSLLETPSKRVKNVDGSYMSLSAKCNNVTPAKNSHIVPTDAPASYGLKETLKVLASQSPMQLTNTPNSYRNKLGSASRKRDALGLHKPGLSTPAGRSLKNRTLGNLGKRRTSAPFTRIDPPVGLQDAAPLSIDAALSGTIPSYKPKARSTPLQEVHIPTPGGDNKTPASWQFEIHEDTLEETLTNIMEFSTGVLDISDDESKQREKNDRGKENIPPLILESETSTEPPPSNASTTPASPTTRSASFGPVTRSQKPREARRQKSSPYYRAPLAEIVVWESGNEADVEEEKVDGSENVIEGEIS